jgi:MOSC domain-containing protein YiiM
MKNAWLFQINISDGGVPKYPVRKAEVNNLGIIGDHQRNQKNHGGPERALCLYSLDHIMSLQSKGHPIFPGSIGENLTLAGLDWDELVPGARFQIGSELITEIASFASPCEVIGESFSDSQFILTSQDHHPGWSRLYTRVLTPGNIQIGDTVTRL